MQSEKMNASMMSNNAEFEEQNNFVEKEVIETIQEPEKVESELESPEKV